MIPPNIQPSETPENHSYPALLISLRNLHNTYAREHPLWIFKAIFLHAAGGLRQDRPPLLFHPQEKPLPHRIQRDEHYHLELIFPGWKEEDVSRFPQGLSNHLSDSARNFQLVDCSSITYRDNTSQVLLLRQELDLQSEEICLDFLTPLAFKGPDPDPDGIIRRITGRDLAQMLDRRTREITGTPLPQAAHTACEQLIILPWFWHFEKHAHKPKSRNGSRMQLLAGMQGPLYLRGPWQPLLPWLSLASSFHLGNKVGNGCGHFNLSTFRPYYDRKLSRPGTYLDTLDELKKSEDSFLFLSENLEAPDEMAAELTKRILSGQWQPAPSSISHIPKSSGGARPIVLLPDEDRIVHKTLQRLLTPAAEINFPREVIGFRPGHGIHDAHDQIAEALRSGATHVFESDISSFFDDLRWDRMEDSIDSLIPRADVICREILSKCIRCPVTAYDKPVYRDRGVLQGSPLSPLLSNLYMIQFDREMISTGAHYLRYGDDFLLLTRSEADARQVLQSAFRMSTEMGLQLNESKTAIRSTTLGFHFLGNDFSADPGEQSLHAAAFKKALFIGGLYAFAGIDGETVTLRQHKKIIHQVPLNRLGEIILLGDNSVSTRLLETCHHHGIPVSFCSRGGHFLNSLVPTGRDWFDKIASHQHQRNQLKAEDEVTVARHLVRSKLQGYLRWLEHLPGEHVKVSLEKVRKTLKRLESPEQYSSVDEIRGAEGSAAAVIFPLINRLAVDRDPAFQSSLRLPHEKPDRFNALLDFAYSALFARIHVLTRHRGLNPYAGFLHSPKNNYQSLVCDLQEPFRARMDRLCTRSIGQKKITPEDFLMINGKWWMSSPAMGKFMEAFEREMEVCLTGDPETLGNLITLQINAIAHWAGNGGLPRIYLPPGSIRKHSS